MLSGSGAVNSYGGGEVKRMRIGRLVGLLAFMVSSPLAGQEIPDALARSFEEAERKILALAEVIPAEIYVWAPSEEVRTFSEAFMHVAAGNFVILGRIAAPFPLDAPQVWYRDPESVTEKAAVLDALRGSFGWAGDVLEGTGQEEYPEQAANAGPGTTVVSQLVLLNAHAHEHLGQLIAYARMNGIAPPWSR